MPRSWAGSRGTRRPGWPTPCSQLEGRPSAGSRTCGRTQGELAHRRSGLDMSASTTLTPLPIRSSASAAPYYVPPTSVPGISRFSVVADPQQATFVLCKWLQPGEEKPADPSAAGRVGWHELLAANWERAFPFYSALFGWQRADTDSEAMSTYQQFSAGGQTIGGMYTKPASVPMPFWLYYFNSNDVDAAAKAGDRRWRPHPQGADRRARRRPGRPMPRSAGRHVCAGGKAQQQAGRIFSARRGARSCGWADLRA